MSSLVTPVFKKCRTSNPVDIGFVWGFLGQIRFNSVRPITAIRYLYGKKNITAWGGPYRGTRKLTGKGYRSFLKTMQHAEYVSGSACYCAAEMTAFQNLYGDDVFGLNYTYPAGIPPLLRPQAPHRASSPKTPPSPCSPYFPMLSAQTRLHATQKSEKTAEFPTADKRPPTMLSIPGKACVGTCRLLPSVTSIRVLRLLQRDLLR